MPGRSVIGQTRQKENRGDNRDDDKKDKDSGIGETGKKGFPQVKRKKFSSSSSFKMPGRSVIGQTRQKENRGDNRDDDKKDKDSGIGETGKKGFPQVRRKKLSSSSSKSRAGQ
jgi:hypothetical protein